MTRFMTDSDPHVIYCRGCGRTWLSPDCACTCTDGDPHYEDWVVNPWVCYCGVIAEFSEYLFPHADCDGGKPLAATPYGDPGIRLLARPHR